MTVVRAHRPWAFVAREIRVPLGFAFAGLYLWLAHPTWISLFVGVLITLPGIGLRAWASGSVKKNDELATEGPYAYTRNPLYLGSLLIAIGFGVAGRNLWVLAAIILLLLVIYYPVMLSEEEYLRAQFPAYNQFEKNVPRLFPKFMPSCNVGVFSRQLYLKHREYNALIGTVLLIAFLVVKILLFPRA